MRNKTLTTAILVSLVAVFFIGASFANGPVKPTEKDKCPVCGMRVMPYPNWIAEIIFNDGAYAVFDGPKDMLKYYFDVPKYNRQKTKEDIAEIYVTEYYGTKLVKAEDVYFIIGSDVRGPMGDEIVPLRAKAEAEVFMRDHKGKKILTFEQLTPADLPGLTGMHKTKHGM
jgi:nitrous oxide reductase accessory protein NosL